MLGTDFATVLWRNQEQYIRDMNNGYKIGRFSVFRDVFDYLEGGQTVAQICCGSIVDDLFLTMDRVGRNGKIILIDEDPAFIYNRAVTILGNPTLPRKGLPQKRGFYVTTEEGKSALAKLFSQANVYPYVRRLPPYPEQIADGSLDHAMAINAAFELMATSIKGDKREEPDVEGLVAETYRKLRPDGSLIVQGLMEEDIYLFANLVAKASQKRGLKFEDDEEFEHASEFNDSIRGYWKRWIKKQ